MNVPVGSVWQCITSAEESTVAHMVLTSNDEELITWSEFNQDPNGPGGWSFHGTQEEFLDSFRQFKQ